MIFDSMCLLINIWYVRICVVTIFTQLLIEVSRAAIVLGLQYLTLQSFPVIFEQGHGFSMQETGLTFLGMGAGMLLALAFQPLFIRYVHGLYISSLAPDCLTNWLSRRYTSRQAAKHNGNLPPEVHLVIGQVGAIILPISLFWLAFTTYPHVHWIWPVLASALFGAGVLYNFTAIFTYLVTAYRPVAASAMASNTFMRGSSAAAFPLFAKQMYIRMGAVGATAMLAGLTTLAAPLP